MPRGPTTFKQRDVTRALIATRAAGYAVDRFEIARDGNIVVVPVRENEKPSADSKENEWDRI